MPKKAAPANDIFYRGLTEATAIIDKKRRVVRVSFSSEQPYERSSYFEKPWIEVLGHEPDEVDLSRLNSGATVHYNHSRTREDRLGKVERAWIENGRGMAEIRFSKRAGVADIWDDIADGLIANISVGYRIIEKELTKAGDNNVDEFRVTSWQPMEISIVDIPADHTVGVGRMFSVPFPPDRDRTDPSVATFLRGEMNMPGKTKSLAGVEEGKRLANERVIEINNLFNGRLETPVFRSLHSRCLNDPDLTIDEVSTLLLKEIGKNKTPTGVGHFQPGDSSRAIDLNDNFVDGFLHRSGIINGEISEEAKSVGTLSFRDIVRANLEMCGSYYPGMTPAEEWKRFHTSDDLKNVLANIATKVLIAGFDNEELATHREWTTKVDVPNYKPVKAVALSEIGDLSLVGEGGELTYTTVSDTGIDIELARYERGIIYSREMFINDDLGVLINTPQNFARAALRLEKNLVFLGLTSNPTMGDGNPLFDAAHGNVGTAAALSVASLGEAKKLMRLQMNLEGLAFLDIMPAFLIIPAALETVAEVLINSIFDPDGTTSSAQNPFARKLRIIVEPRLDADSATAWYLVCSPSTFHWFSRVYLNGIEEPTLEGPIEDFDTSGLKFKARHEFTAAPILWQGAVKNDGA